MKMTQWVLVGLTVAGLAACDGGGVKLNVSTVDSSCTGDNACSPTTNNPGGGANTSCASYTDPDTGQLVQGSLGGPTGTQCVYGSNFVGAANPLLVDVSIPAGTHIFSDSLFVGQDVSNGVAPAEGEGPTLTIQPGATLVFQNPADYVLITRGAKIIANGQPTKPITFTSYQDAILGTAGANDVQQWGGMVINGNGITNNCTDAERANNQCHVTAEGQPSHYGGSNNAESSGSLRYVIVKHSGFEVAPGDELNGITFNTVGSGTVVENVEVYSTYDDGMEFFGGAVSPRNVVILYARDDSLDYSDGFVGTIEHALVIHWVSDGNRCIEGDNVGQSRTDSGVPFDLAPLTEPVIKNMTCIVSNIDQSDGGTHGDSEGPLARQGGKLRLENSIVYSGYGTIANGKTSNECYEVESTESLAFAAAGNNFHAVNVLIGCEDPAKGTLANGDSMANWFLNTSTNGANYGFNTGTYVITDVNNPNVSILDPGTFYTAASFKDAAGATIVADTTGWGAVSGSNDWTAPWAFGLDPANADEPLWFVP